MKSIWFGITVILLAAPTQRTGSLRKDDGYRGIWYSNQPTNDQYHFKYSGGFATYPQQQEPIAIYVKKVNKTFFCYGGSVKGKQELLHMVSYYDHSTGMVPHPTILLDKQTTDAHDNPTISVDDGGYIWIFSSAHGTSRSSYIHRSTKPYSIDEFERIAETNFSYTQPWYISGRGFLFLHTRYNTPRPGSSVRSLFWMTSADGRSWSDPHLLARMDLGHYQISLSEGARVLTFFNYHPSPIGLNARTNLYYLETSDMGHSWQNIQGEKIQPPLTEIENRALVRDYRSEHLLVFLKDLQLDAEGHPVILYLTSKGWQPGPENGPRILRTARWTGKEWQYHTVTSTDANYDYGAFYIEPDGMWRIFATTDPGPFPWGTGGEVVMWTSRDKGVNWQSRNVTSGSKLNQNYPRRPVNARPDFYAIWADGNPLEPSDSSLYFTNREGSGVWKLPSTMSKDFEKPQRIH